MTINELTALEAKATPGPWKWSKTYEIAYYTNPDDSWNPDDEPQVYSKWHWAITDPSGDASGRVTSLGLISQSASKPHGEFGFLDDPNVLLVTAMRNALPALIEVAKAAKAMADYWSSDRDDEANPHIEAIENALAKLEAKTP